LSTRPDETSQPPRAGPAQYPPRVCQTASAAPSRRVRKVVAYPPLCEMDDPQRREFHEALLDADGFADLPGKWQAAIMKSERNRPNLRIVGSD
jgi:hypothetical protein